MVRLWLPDCFGMDVVRELNPEISTGNLCVVVLSADAVSIDALKSISLGVLEFLVNAVKASALHAILCSAF